MSGSGPARLLVVEDEEAIAQGLAVNLERKGHRVDLARDGQEALERAATDRYDPSPPIRSAACSAWAAPPP